MTTNGQLNDTRGYHIKPTNSTGNMSSGFRLKGSCSSVHGKHFYCQRSQNYRKVLSKKINFVNEHVARHIRYQPNTIQTK